MEYLDQSIQKLEEAVGYKLQSSLERASEFQNLGIAYMQRFSLAKGKTQDLERSVQMIREALNHYPPEDVSISDCYRLLGDSLQQLSKIASTNSEDEVLEVSKCYEEAVNRCPEGHPHRAYCLLAQGRFYANQFNRHDFKNIDALNKAITLTENALSLIPANTPDRGPALLLLGCTLPMRAMISTDLREEDVVNGLSYYKEAAALSNGYPLIRIKAARFAIRLLKGAEDWKEMKALGEKAMELVPLVCGRYQRLHDQQRALRHISGLAADVCSILLKIGLPEEALSAVEFGKGIVSGYIIDSRDELEALRTASSDLAREYESLRGLLCLSPDEPEPSIPESRMRERRTAARDMVECLQKIRKIEGYEDFLRGLPLNRMRECAEEGPIVVVNITDIGSNAIMISTSQVRAITLPDIELGNIPDFISDNIRSFGSYQEKSPRDGKLILPELWRKSSTNQEDPLEWLWRTCVKVVLDELKAAGMISDNGRLPRVWWIGSGVASSFPFHAAGPSLQHGEDALSRMIPSYVPSIKALLHSRRRSQNYQPSTPKQTVTVVTMATTPNHTKLPGVSNESDAINKECTDIYNCRVLKQPDVDLVLKSIIDSEIVHFACHGVSDARIPIQSHLILQKNGEQGIVIDKLSVSKILGLKESRFAWISYLSACSTADTRGSELADEGLHISSALQLAGFAHVIGSLWVVDDTVSVLVAGLFYKNLILKRKLGLGNRAVAEALREAVLNVRKVHSTPWKWAAYIHSGA